MSDGRSYTWIVRAPGGADGIVFRSEARRYLGSASRSGRSYDLVFLDPPYRLDAALARARDLVADAERQRARLTDELEQATARLADRRTDFDRARTQAERATAERSRLDERLASLKEP